MSRRELLRGRRRAEAAGEVPRSDLEARIAELEAENAELRKRLAGKRKKSDQAQQPGGGEG